MGDMISVISQDDVSVSAYRAEPSSAVRGGLVILQEIFGLNSHIRSVCDSFAKQGWQVIAPSLFDPVRPGIELRYDREGVHEGKSLKEQVDGRAEQDIASVLSLFDNTIKRAVVGYCWGGSLAWRLACHNSAIDAAVSYYGGQLPALHALKPSCPVLAHFGRRDKSIPLEAVENFISAQPDVDYYLYEADHGFNCDQRAQYHAASAALARRRTDDFLAAHLNG